MHPRPNIVAREADHRLIADLTAGIEDGVVVADPDVLVAYHRDQALLAPAGSPVAAVLARTVDDVRATLAIATSHGASIVPRGAGTGLSGGANAVDGCVVLCLDRMDQIQELDRVDQRAVVQPGVLNGTLSAAAAELGLWYPPDPASADISTIGGNIATNAGGLCCVKYGTTGDSVLGLEVVLADGTVVRTGGRTVKDVAGYDLTSLIVGSEGTLGIVTEATLRLRPTPPPPSTLVGFFPTLGSAGRAVAEMTAAGIVPSLLELMDRTTVCAVDDHASMGLDRNAAALLFAQSDAAGGDEIDRLATLWDSVGASYIALTRDAAEAELLLAARKLAYPALERCGATLLDDVGVPPSRIPALLDDIERIAETHGVLIGTFGHVGDGNMHPTVVYDIDDPGQEAAARSAFAAILLRALDHGGTITGEHGVGVLKQPFLARQLGPSVEIHRRVKRAFDPKGLLNPGKAVP